MVICRTHLENNFNAKKSIFPFQYTYDYRNIVLKWGLILQLNKHSTSSQAFFIIYAQVHEGIFASNHLINFEDEGAIST